jgi:hypothetical protein
MYGEPGIEPVSLGYESSELTLYSIPKNILKILGVITKKYFVGTAGFEPTSAHPQNAHDTNYTMSHLIKLPITFIP